MCLNICYIYIFQGDEDEDEKESIQVDDYLQTKNSKIIDTNVASLRLDAIAKAGFGISRTYVIVYRNTI